MEFTKFAVHTAVAAWFATSLAAAAPADAPQSGRSVVLQNDPLALVFDRKTGTLTALQNKLTGETYQVRGDRITGFPGGMWHRLGLRQPSLGRRDGEDECAGGGRQLPARSRLQDRADPLLDRIAAGHGGCCSAAWPPTADRGSHIQQHGGVLVGPPAESKDRIVTGQFPLDSQPPVHQPGQRMKPVERTSQPGHDLPKHVVPGHVRQFMDQNDPPFGDRPVCAIGGQQDL